MPELVNFAHAQVPALSPYSPSSAGTWATAEGNTLQIKRITNSQQVMLNSVNADIYSVFRAVGSPLLRLQGIAKPENERSMLVVTQTDANNTSSGFSANNFLTMTDYAENVRHLARSSSVVPGQYTDHERPSLWSFSDLRPHEQSRLLLLAMLGVLLAVPFISAFTSCDKKLRTEAERIAHLLTLAYEKVQLTGQTIVWEADERGYRFLRRQGARLTLVTDDKLLGARQWSVLPMQLHTSAALSPSSATEGLQLALERRSGDDHPFLLVLLHGDCSATVQGDGLGNFRADD